MGEEEVGWGNNRKAILPLANTSLVRSVKQGDGSAKMNSAKFTSVYHAIIRWLPVYEPLRQSGSLDVICNFSLPEQRPFNHVAFLS